MTDEQLLNMWLHGRPAKTKDTYGHEGKRLLSATGKPLLETGLEDLQSHVDGLAHLAPRTQAKAISAIKSLFDFLHERGLIASNPGSPLRPPKVANDLAERILDRDEVLKLIAAAPAGRDHAAVSTLYIAGLRASELCGLRWRNVIARADGEGQLSIFGKGGKTRSVVIPSPAYAELLALKGSAGPGDRVFGFGERTLQNIVKRAAIDAGLGDRPSCHWLRHCHASHTIDAGAPLSLVQATLGHSSAATTSRYLHARPNDSSARYLAGPTLQKSA
jgi:integrase/recombinase XerD